MLNKIRLDDGGTVDVVSNFEGVRPLKNSLNLEAGFFVYLAEIGSEGWK